MQGNCDSKRTKIVAIDTATQQSILDTNTRIDSRLFAKDFQSITKPPFRISVVGIVQKVEGEMESQAGKAMQSFKFHDCTGRHLSCMAFGRHAGTPAIAEGNEIIIYFASGLAGLQGKPGSLWLYDEAHVVCLRKNCKPPVARHFIDLRAQS